MRRPRPNRSPEAWIDRRSRSGSVYRHLQADRAPELRRDCAADEGWTSEAARLSEGNRRLWRNDGGVTARSDAPSPAGSRLLHGDVPGVEWRRRILRV